MFLCAHRLKWKNKDWNDLHIQILWFNYKILNLLSTINNILRHWRYRGEKIEQIKKKSGLSLKRKAIIPMGEEVRKSQKDACRKRRRWVTNERNGRKYTDLEKKGGVQITKAVFFFFGHFIDWDLFCHAFSWWCHCMYKNIGMIMVHRPHR